MTFLEEERHRFDNLVKRLYRKAGTLKEVMNKKKNN